MTKAKELRKVSPYDVIGRIETNPPKAPLSGYDSVFPSVQNCWQANYNMLRIVFEQHDVSKHRETIFSGGKARNDPPPGFFESLGIGEDASHRALFWPMKEIILRDKPKIPHAQRVQQPREKRILLENLAQDFKTFIGDTAINALNDAKTNIELKFNYFKKA